MKRSTRIWLLTAGALILVGCIVFAGVMTSMKWNFGKLSTVQLETRSYESGEAFRDVSATTDAADVVFVKSGDGVCRVECRELPDAPHTVRVEDGVLVIKAQEDRDWTAYLGVGFETPRITVYLPDAEYGALTVHSGAGNVTVPDGFSFASADVTLGAGNAEFAADAAGAVRLKSGARNVSASNVEVGALDASVSAGRVTLTGVRCREDITVDVTTGESRVSGAACQSIRSTGGTGSLLLVDVIAEERMEIERSTGDVDLDGCDAGEISIKTSTGDVTASLLTQKVFLVESATGSVDVPRTTRGGTCEVTSGTGDIEITIKVKSFRQIFSALRDRCDSVGRVLF